MTSIKIVNAPESKFFQTSNNKRPGLAVLVGVGCCHERNGLFQADAEGALPVDCTCLPAIRCCVDNS
jgi:hypothetical protein